MSTRATKSAAAASSTTDPLAAIGARSIPEPRWLQILPSTELADWKRFWPVRPTSCHGGISYETITGSRG